jgi:hypothetical protein
MVGAMRQGRPTLWGSWGNPNPESRVAYSVHATGDNHALAFMGLACALA